MAHSSSLRWDGAEATVSASSTELLEGLFRAENRYQDLLEVYQYSGGTEQAMADQLFQDENGIPPGDPIADTATAAQVALITDLRGAIQAMHELYEAAANVVVTQDDRLAALRRMG